MSDSLWPYEPYPTRLLCPWDFPGKNIAMVAISFTKGSSQPQGSNPRLLYWQVDSLPQSHQGKVNEWSDLILGHSVMSNSCNPMACSPPGSSVHGILQARILEWVSIPFSRGSSWPRDWSWVSHIAGRFFTIWVPREAQISRGVCRYSALLSWELSTESLFNCLRASSRSGLCSQASAAPPLEPCNPAFLQKPHILSCPSPRLLLVH